MDKGKEPKEKPSSSVPSSVPAAQWTVSQLLERMQEASFTDMMKEFEENAISGLVLKNLTKEVLRDDFKLKPASVVAFLAIRDHFFPPTGTGAQIQPIPNISDTIKNALNIFKIWLKEEPKARKLATNHLGWKPLNRKRCFEKVYKTMAKKRDYSVNERFANPLIVVHSYPGGGKSYFLDHIVSLEHLDDWVENPVKPIPHEQRKKLRTTLQESIRVTVSFNSITPYNQAERDCWEHFFCLRMLFG